VQITAQRKFFGNMEYGREIPTIGTEIIEKQNVNNASDILHARLAGVWATKTSGAPGDHQKIRIRGQTSFFSSAEPLYVVDGVPVPIVNLSSLGITDLNIHDIENITVLKDASSTALYGYQGGNGVVLIDTKKGGKKQISFSTKFGFQWFDNFYDMMSSRKQLTALDSAYSKTGLYMTLRYPDISDTLCDHDRQKEIFKNGIMTENQLSASGSFGKTAYYLSGNYMKHTGILPGSEYERYTLSAKIRRQFFGRLAIEAGYRGSRQFNKNNQEIYRGNRLLFEGVSESPCLECTPYHLMYDTLSGRLKQRIFYDYNQLNQPELPESIINNNRHSLNIGTQAINLSGRFRFTEHLSLNAMGSFMYRHSGYDLAYRYYYYSPYGSTPYDILLNSTEDVILINHQYSISYFNTFKQHETGFSVAYRFYEDNLWWQVDTVKGTLNSYSYLRNSMATYGVDGSVLRALSSYVGNASYSFRRKYFVSAVANISRVKEGLHTDYYTLFPSLAVSWDLAQENLFSRIGWLGSFKLYVNWGKSGNYPLNGLANDLYREVKTTYGTASAVYPAVQQLANHYLKHESTEETNYGFTASFINRRLNVSAVYYTKKIENLIVNRDIPYYYGGGNQYINVGELSVTGFETGIEADPVRMPDFAWHLNFNFSSSRQVTRKLLEDEAMVFSEPDILFPQFVVEEGRELGEIYGYRCLGKWTAEDDLAGNNQYLESGGLKYLNADSTNDVLDANDMVVTGNSVPRYTLNFSNTFTYKNFGIDMLWYAVLGMDKFNATRAATIMTCTGSEVNGYIADSLSAIGTDIFYQSSEFVDQAGFVRLKTLTFSYEPAKELFGHARLRFSLSFENLVTITKYRGYDPEATIFTDNNFSDNAIDRGAVPNPKAIYVTIRITL
jgi:TonB-linked SusC/RagA family outer membrane protein